MFKRSEYQKVITRLKEPRNFIQVILGPRQVGKTTLIHQVLESISTPWHYASADAVTTGNIWVEQQWETARTKAKLKNASEFLLVIDEIQKIENWSEQVKLQWDADIANQSNMKVVLLGSSSLMIQKGLTESLAGRYEILPLMHWSYSEMEAAFGFTPEQFVYYGGYPGAATIINEEERWRQYVLDALIEPTISKDILMMTRIDKPALMKRLFELTCAYSGQIVSFNKMLGQLQDAGNTTTLSHYLKLLDQAGLVSGLSKKYKEKVRQKASIPKYQVYNTALMLAQKDDNFREVLMSPERWGRYVESAIGAHLLNYAKSGMFRLYYWRHGNSEIDFVIEKGHQLIGIEVKSGLKSRTRGMEQFKRTFPHSKVILVGEAGLSWKTFLGMNPVELFD